MVEFRLWTLQARNHNFQAETRLAYRLFVVLVSSSYGVTRHDPQGEVDTLKPQLYILSYAGDSKMRKYPTNARTISREEFRHRGTR